MTLTALILTDTIREPQYTPNGKIIGYRSKECIIDDSVGGNGWGEFISLNGNDVVREPNLNIRIPETDLKITTRTDDDGRSFISVNVGKIYMEYCGKYYLHLDRDSVYVSQWIGGYDGGYRIIANIPFSL